MRIACIQNGNFTEARERLASGGFEVYGGQRYTVNAFTQFVGRDPHLVISLDAPTHRVTDGNGTYLSVGERSSLRPIPRRITELWRARKITRELERFRPTHLLLRCNDVIGCEVLQWAIARQIPSAVIIASRFRVDHAPFRRFCTLANNALVSFVANHNRVATKSLIECGLDPAKAVMWDYPPDVEPRYFLPKVITKGQRISIVYAGMTIVEKGVLDLVEACAQLRQSNLPVELTVIGEGPALGQIQAHDGGRDGWLRALGRRDHQEVLQKMRQSTFVAVPSRHEYPEALPCVVQESLAVRTPVILSNHPVFKEYFSDGQAVKLFQAGSAESLANVFHQMISNPVEYARLSQQTEQVWQSFQIENKFHHLLEQLSVEWKIDTMPRRSGRIAA